MSARSWVSELGKVRSAPQIGAHEALASLATSPGPGAARSSARTVLSISFEPGTGAPSYRDDCGPLLVDAPVVLTARFSSGEHWQSPATLSVREDRTAVVRLEANQRAPFQLSARLMADNTDVELTPVGATRPVRFSTLCGVDVKGVLTTELGLDPSALLRLNGGRALQCSRKDGSRAELPVPENMTLVAHDQEACAPHPLAASEFGMTVNIAAPWSNERLHGKATVVREEPASAVRYRVHGKARAHRTLAILLPCAASDSNISVALEGEARGPAPALPARTKLTFSFSCEDVAVECVLE